MKEEKTAFFPEWVTDRELFVNYMKDISFWEKPFSWDSRPEPENPEPAPLAPEPEPEISLSQFVGDAIREFFDPLLRWRR